MTGPSAPGDRVELSRRCRVTTIPYGDPDELPAGTSVQVVQMLGGSITVRTGYGALLRIDGADADALGLRVEQPDPGAPAPTGYAAPFSMSQVTDALRSVYDPEIPVNVVDLGLIYRCDEVIRPDGTRLLSIDMSMTAPGCGMGDVLRDDAARVVRAVPGVDDVEVSLVWDPPWSIHRISEATRLELGLL